MRKDTLTLKGKRWEALCVLTVYPLGQCWYNSSYRPVQLDVQCRKFHRSNYTHFFQADVFIINSSSSNWEEYLLFVLQTVLEFMFLLLCFPECRDYKVCA